MDTKSEKAAGESGAAHRNAAAKGPGWLDTRFRNCPESALPEQGPLPPQQMAGSVLLAVPVAGTDLTVRTILAGREGKRPYRETEAAERCRRCHRPGEGRANGRAEQWPVWFFRWWRMG